MVYKSSHNNDFVTSVNSETGDIDITSNGGTINITTPTAHTINLEAAPIPGGVTTTGTPAAGNLTKFSAAATITNGDLSGDVTTSGTLVTAIKSSVALAGSPTTTTQTQADNSTKIATTAYVDAATAGKASSTLTSAHILVGNVSNVATDVAMSGDVTITNAGVTAIKSSVALAGSPTTTTQTAADNSTKIATTAYADTAVANKALTNTHILVGNVSNIATDVAMSGDVTITNAGVTAIKSSVALAGSPTTTTQTQADNSTKIATTAYVDTGLSGKTSSTLTSAHLLVGNVSNVATDVAVSGDLTLANTGAFTVAKIQSTVVSGTSGSGNVAFTTSPTLTTPIVTVKNAAKTTGYNVLTTDSLATLTNVGAVGSVTFTLPAAAVGLLYKFSCDAAQTVVVAANTGDRIRNGASLTASAGNLTSDATVSCFLSVECTSANLWRVTSISGTWTVN